MNSIFKKLSSAERTEAREDTRPELTFTQTAKILRSSRLVHKNWYLQAYPEVAELGLDPTTHYLRYGAEMGRDPGKTFSTRYYLETYSEVAESGMNPLLHYILIGRDKGYKPRPDKLVASNPVHAIRMRLLSLGFTEQPLDELRAMADGDPKPAIRAEAAREIALWYARNKNAESVGHALEQLATARTFAPDWSFRTKLAVAEMLCNGLLGNTEKGIAAYDRAALAGEATPDVMLARANFEGTPERRLIWMNQALKRYAIPPMGLLLPDGASTPYDRLCSSVELPRVRETLKVTVIIAAYDAPTMLPTALRSLQEQTWQNLEIIVVDDCSPNNATFEAARHFADRDPRIKVMRMGENAGAYVARNHALDHATGDFVTIHDADDWSHPLKIETQVRHLLDNPSVMGCTSEQARCTEDLQFTKLRSSGGFIVFNTSSFLWRRLPVQEALGYWDSVRFGADNEFIRRMQVVFGKKSFQKLPTGPLSFQREAESSITTDPIKGLDSGGFYYGVRREYHDAQMHHHRTATSLKYGNDRRKRPFPVPPMMMMPGSQGYGRRFDIVLCDDFRTGSPNIDRLCTEIEVLADEGKRLGLVEIYDYANDAQFLDERVRELVARGLVEVVVYGDNVEADEIRFGEGLAADKAHRFMPSLVSTG